MEFNASHIRNHNGSQFRQGHNYDWNQNVTVNNYYVDNRSVSMPSTPPATYSKEADLTGYFQEVDKKLERLKHQEEQLWRREQALKQEAVRMHNGAMMRDAARQREIEQQKLHEKQRALELIYRLAEEERRHREQLAWNQSLIQRGSQQRAQQQSAQVQYVFAHAPQQLNQMPINQGYYQQAQPSQLAYTAFPQTQQVSYRSPGLQPQQMSFQSPWHSGFQQPHQVSTLACLPPAQPSSNQNKTQRQARKSEELTPIQQVIGLCVCGVVLWAAVSVWSWLKSLFGA